MRDLPQLHALRPTRALRFRLDAIMRRRDLDRRRWRALPRERCAVFELIGGECAGPIHRHHLMPVSEGGWEDGVTVQVCQRHHPMLEALARRVHNPPLWRRCRHRHRTLEAREQCERRLNRDHDLAAA